jgi:hypothetical protein
MGDLKKSNYLEGAIADMRPSPKFLQTVTDLGSAE